MRRRHVALALAVSLSAPALGAEPVVGRASVIDGDTIEIRGTRFRLQGVDTPEHAQLCRDRSGKEYRCGQVAANALADKIGAGNVACDPITTDRYRRTVAICRLGAGGSERLARGRGFRHRLSPLQHRLRRPGGGRQGRTAWAVGRLVHAALGVAQR